MARARNARVMPLLIAVCLLSFPAEAKYSGGTGESNDPYQITSAEDLMLLGDSPEDYDKHFILTADIDLDPNLPGRKVFDKAIIGYFTGVFDGKDHIISHLTIAGVSYLGLFGQLGSGAIISNLGLEVVDIFGTGDCVGGLVGWNWGRIATSYSTGSVTGNEDVGGLVGDNDYGSVTASFWDIETSGQSANDGGTGKTAVEMQTALTFLNAGWDFMDETDNGTEDIWWILEGQDYPGLWWQAAGQ